RFAVELESALAEAARRPSTAFARGMGDWDGYGIHTLSLAIGALGPGVVRLIDTGDASSACVTLEYADGRRDWLDVRVGDNQWDALYWSFGLRVGSRYVTGTVRDFDGFYANLMRRAVHFFRTGESPISIPEMLNVVAVLEGAARSRVGRGTWVPLAD